MTDFNLSDLKKALDSGGSDAGVLSCATIEGITDFIKRSKPKKIITMAGAGISTAAGIPDFRSPGKGLYDNLEEYDLPHPMAVFSLDYFMINPEPFFKVAKRLYRPLAKPTLGHYFIQLLHEKNMLLRHYTQNVDNLERLAGLPDSHVIEAHGSFYTGHCMKCNAKYDFEFMKDLIMADQVPSCTRAGCKGIVKPDIVFFGEGLPRKFHECISKDFKDCDLLIVMGTSLTVAPFCSLVDRVQSSVPRLYINREASVFSFDGIPWDDPDNKRDVFVQADIDDGVLRLCELLGWKADLLKLKARTDALLDVPNRGGVESTIKLKRP